MKRDSIIELEILYRDQWLVAINKPAGMLVHPGDDPKTKAPIVMKLLRDQISAKVWATHRIDCPTSGVLIFSLSNQMLPHLRKLFEYREVEKVYQAWVHQKTPKTWSNLTPLKKAESEPDRAAETHFIRRRQGEINGEGVSFLSINPITGRYHQIRKHLAMLGFAIVGDYRYGDLETNKRFETHAQTSGLMLHAKQLAFSHPVTSEDLIIDAPLPKRFEQFSSRIKMN